MNKSKKFSPEVRERAVRMVQVQQGEYPSLWAAVEVDRAQDWLCAADAADVGAAASGRYRCTRGCDVSGSAARQGSGAREQGAASSHTSLDSWGENEEKLADLIRLTGLTRNTVTGLYRETKARIDIDTLDAVCQHYSCSMGELLEYMPDIDEVVEDGWPR